MSDHHRHDEFWMKLLAYALNDTNPYRYWNYFIRTYYKGNIHKLLAIGGNDNLWQQLEVESYNVNYDLAVRHAAKKLGVPHDWQINFSEKKFIENISFKNFVMIRANFRDAIFKGRTDFQKAIFLGKSDFRGARFDGCKSEAEGGRGMVSFEGSEFHDEVSFDNVHFPHTTRFNGVTFYGALSCQKTTFDCRSSDSECRGVTNSGSRSCTEADLSDTKFATARSEGCTPEAQGGHGMASFERSEFHDIVNFGCAQFPQTTKFNDTIFRGSLNCRKATFDWRSSNLEDQGATSNGSQTRTEPGCCEAEFTPAKSEGCTPESQGGHGMASFERSKFHDIVNFDNVRFPHITRFDNSVFFNSLHCRKAMFDFQSDESKNGEAVFSGSKFISEADFSKTEFEVATIFERITFQGKLGFRESCFRAKISFNSTKFKNTISFRKAMFERPPNFFEADLYEDVDFGRVDWSGAERSYRRRSRQSSELESIEESAGNAVRAWDRLALIMSKQEKPAERHEFFRLKMRAQRRRDGLSLVSIVNWIFDKSSDYGWGVGRAFFWWTVHVFSGAAILVLAAWCRNVASDQVSVLTIATNGLLVSFGNSLAFLGLVSEGGYLRYAHDFIEDAIGDTNSAIVVVGTNQAVLGPVLLFLVLLTLRNRFRLG